MKLVALVFLAGFAGFRATTVAEESTPPPSKISSPDHRHTIRILDRPLKGAESDYDRTIAVYAGEKLLSQFPTMGYLLDASWSPGGQFVAVNNRRANSGDYLWVFSLNKGKAIKVPDDQSDDALKAKHALVQRVRSKFPEYTYEELERDFTTGRGWKSATELNVRTSVVFHHAGAWHGVVIGDVYKVDGRRLVLADQQIRKESSEF